jgi:hypothetical protein
MRQSVDGAAATRGQPSEFIRRVRPIARLRPFSRPDPHYTGISAMSADGIRVAVSVPVTRIQPTAGLVRPRAADGGADRGDYSRLAPGVGMPTLSPL